MWNNSLAPVTVGTHFIMCVGVRTSQFVALNLFSSLNIIYDELPRPLCVLKDAKYEGRSHLFSLSSNALSLWIFLHLTQARCIR